MSKIGKLPIKKDPNTKILLERSLVTVSGPKGELKLNLPPEVSVKDENDLIIVERINDTDRSKAMHGLIRTLIANMIEGVTKGYEKTLELSGVGFRANLQGQKLVLSIGFSHQVEVDAPEGIGFRTSENKITVSGFDKALVGEVAAKIRKLRPAEPYKGKGIKYEGEIIRRKAGKAGKAGA